MIPLLSQLPEQYSTVILLVLIITAFILAYKVMKMVFQTLAATALSAGFYLALVYLFNFSFSLNNLLFYTFLGASLYLGFNFLASAYQIAETVISVPYKVFKVALIPFKLLYKGLTDKIDLSGANPKEKIKKLKEKRQKQTNKSNSSSDNETKEVVLDKVMGGDNGDES